jgi:hypothetical protein
MRKCPICNEPLNMLEHVMHIRDGNTVYQCTEVEKHRFWIHPFSFTFINWNPEAVEDDFTSYLKWEIIDGEYKLNMDAEDTVRGVISLMNSRDDYAKWAKTHHDELNKLTSKK